MKFNQNQRYTRWSIRRLSVGVASVVVASGFWSGYLTRSL